jgi:acyl-CoA reductase-like NAD-dependent aldehyde dehydrogenase
MALNDPATGQAQNPPETNWQSIGDLAHSLVMNLAARADEAHVSPVAPIFRQCDLHALARQIEAVPEPEAAKLADEFVMSWHVMDKDERLELAHEIADALTDPQRAFLFLALFRVMSPRWQTTVANAMQTELLRAAVAEGKGNEDV